MLTDADGVTAVELAREAIAGGLAGTSHQGARNRPDLPSLFREPRGVFVTLKRHPSGALRGCIGYPLPVQPLAKAISGAALAAAIDDPRFQPVRASELDGLIIEVSILTVPEMIPARRPDDRVAAVRVGRDGLIVEGLGTSGLLLPQVAPEQGWTSEEFLDGVCEKAGLPVRAWRDLRVTVKRFEAEVFGETAPNGPVVREVTTSDARPAR